jgi:hypothetical protein
VKQEFRGNSRICHSTACGLLSVCNRTRAAGNLQPGELAQWCGRVLQHVTLLVMTLCDGHSQTNKFFPSFTKCSFYKQPLMLHNLIFAAIVSFVAAAPFPLRPSSISGSSSYAPTAGWTYAVEAIRQSLWPACPYRFLSFPDSCDKVDLWRGAGSNQMWTLESASTEDTSLFYLRASCGSYLRFNFLSYSLCNCLALNSLQLPF